jgi:IMP dehydrogenase
MIDEIALTFDDISVIPQYSEILPSEVDTSVQLTREIKLNVPIISAAMDTVTEYKMAIALAQLGGLGVIHKNMSIDKQTSQVRMVKRHDGGVVKDPITINGYHDLGEVKTLSEVSGISSFPVVMDYTRYDSSKKILIGFLTARDIRFQTDDSITVEQIMTPYSQLVVATEDMTRDEMKSRMYQFKVEKMPVVKMEGDTPILRGLITMKDMEIMDKMPNATRDKDRRLVVAAAIGVSEAERERAIELISAGADALVVDSAHGHSKRVIEMVEWLAMNYPQIGIIAGNVVTAEGVHALYQAGANCVKVGIGPGSICTTRVVSGVGVPQFTALQNCFSRYPDLTIISDGGIRYSGDILKAFVAGADAVMLGGLLAGTDESPGEVELFEGRAYKHYRGMGSLGAMSGTFSSKDRYSQSHVSSDKLVPEGIEGRVPYRGSVNKVIHQLVGGLMSGMGYIGAATLSDIYNRGHYVQVTAAGMKESHPHDVSITKNAPNYAGGLC